MKKILFYTDTPLSGGAELQMLLLAKNLDKKKCTASLACGVNSSLDSWCSKWTEEGFAVHRVPTTSKHSLKHFFFVRKILKKERFDLVHLHLWNPASCRLALLATRFSNIPYVVTEHDPFSLSTLKEWFRKKILGLPNAVIAVSDENKKFLLKRDPDFLNRIVRIYNGIDSTYFKSQLLGFTSEDREHFRKEQFSATPTDIVILNVATLHERKGQEDLIEAFAIERVKNRRLVLVGDGPARKKLEKLVNSKNLEDSVRFLGQRNDIPKLMRSADIFVLPSRREAFGLVVLEAAACELPIIATSVGGVPEIITDGESGILVNQSDPKSIADAIKKMANDEGLRQRLARNAYEMVVTRFSTQKMAEETQKVYDTVLT